MQIASSFTAAAPDEPSHRPPEKFERHVDMAAQCDLLAAEALLELVNRGITDRIDALQIVPRAAAPDGPLDDAPLTGLADTVLTHISIGTAENLVHIFAHAQDEETGPDFAIFQSDKLRGLDICICVTRRM